MRPLLFQIIFDVPVAILVMGVTLLWSAILLRREKPLVWGAALKQALLSLATFGSKGSTEKTDISVPGSLGTVALALGVYGVVKEPVHLPVFGYAAMAFLAFTFTAIFGWRSGPRLGVPPWLAIKIAFLCAFFGILGSRAFHVVEFWDRDYAAQSAQIRFGKLAPTKGEFLDVKTTQGTTRVTFEGDEKTPRQVIDRMATLVPIGARAQLIKVDRRERDKVEEIQRGFVIETLAKGDTAQLAVSGSALRGQPALESKGYTPPLWTIFAIWQGGLVYYGGMIFGTIAILIFCKLNGERVAGVADVASSVGALGVAFGRMGCFLNGCCWGRRAELPWSIRFPVFSPAWYQHTTTVLGADYDQLLGGRPLTGDVHLDPIVSNALTQAGASDLCQASWPLHPVQIYAILLDLGMFAIIYTYAMRRAKREWEVLWLWFIVYGFVRFLIEHFRADSDSEYLFVLGYPLTPSQKVAVLTMPVAIVGFLWARKKGKLIVPWTPPLPSASAARAEPAKP